MVRCLISVGEIVIKARWRARGRREGLKEEHSSHNLKQYIHDPWTLSF